MNSKTDINCNDAFAEPGLEKSKCKKVTVYLADGREMTTVNVLNVSKCDDGCGNLMLELYGKGKAGKNRKMVFNLTSDNVIGYSIDDEEVSKS